MMVCLTHSERFNDSAIKPYNAQYMHRYTCRNATVSDHSMISFEFFLVRTLVKVAKTFRHDGSLICMIGPEASSTLLRHAFRTEHYMNKEYPRWYT
jgi:hypothetical protein